MSKHIVYRFSVTATLPLTDDPQHPDFYTEAVAVTPVFQRRLEKSLINWLKRFPHNCAVELLDYTVEDDDAAPLASIVLSQHEAECSCDACRAERCMP